MRLAVFVAVTLMCTACVTQKTVTLDVEESPAAVDRIAIRETRAVQNQAMAAGEYDLTITGKNTEIQIDKIDLK